MGAKSEGVEEEGGFEATDRRCQAKPEGRQSIQLGGNLVDETTVLCENEHTHSSGHPQAKTLSYPASLRVVENE